MKHRRIQLTPALYYADAGQLAVTLGNYFTAHSFGVVAKAPGAYCVYWLPTCRAPRLRNARAVKLFAKGLWHHPSVRLAG
jgi:hypothetical protein